MPVPFTFHALPYRKSVVLPSSSMDMILHLPSLVWARGSGPGSGPEPSMAVAYCSLLEMTAATPCMGWGVATPALAGRYPNPSWLLP